MEQFRLSQRSKDNAHEHFSPVFERDRDREDRVPWIIVGRSRPEDR